MNKKFIIIPRSEHVRKYRYECINYDVLPPTEPPVI